jgi:GT2 family glycosyltransferase
MVQGWTAHLGKALSRTLSHANWQRLQRREARRHAADYRRWVQAHDTPGPGLAELLCRRAAALGPLPALGLLVYGGNATLAEWRRSLESLQAQWHADWQAVVLLPPLAPRREALQALLGQDARWQAVGEGELGAVLGRLTQPWIGLLRAGDLLPPQALLLLAEATLLQPPAQWIYGDLDALDAAGQRCQPDFKPDWNPELLLVQPYIVRPALLRRERWLDACALGDWPDEPAEFEHELALRCTAGLAAAAVRHVPHVLCHGAAPAASPDAVRRHLARQGCAAEVDRCAAGGLRVHFARPVPPPLVTLIVPTRDRVELLRCCVDSLYARTSYPSWQLLVVDNGSVEPATRAYLAQLQAEGRARVLRDDGPFNYSALNNAAAAQAEGEFLLLLNNDTEVMNRGWLDEMVGLALQPGVGAVGARLWFADRTLQHAGLVLGLDGVAGYPHRRLRPGAPGYQGRALALRAVGAVTAACLLVRRRLFLEVGGLDAEGLAVAYNDVDLCLKLRRAGYRILWTPNADLFHHESLSRGSDLGPEKAARFGAEYALMRDRWGAWLDRDPQHNPNLALTHGGHVPAWPPRVSLERPWYAEPQVRRAENQASA